MPKQLLKFGLAAVVFFGLAVPVLAQSAPVEVFDPAQLLPAGLTLFLPLGLLLLLSSAVPEENAPAAAINLLVVWAVAVLAYFAVGFAFHFGGVAQVTPQPDLAGLYWEWYPLDQSVAVDIARLWGLIALQGWGLAGAASRPGALLLFLSHLSLVGATAMIPAGTLLQRGRGAAAILMGAVTGALVYPVAGNWVWGGGWLGNLGASLNLGHGFVDFGGASVIFLMGGVITLAGLIVFRSVLPNPTRDVTPETARDEDILADARLMPSAYLPILSVLGGGLLLLGWLGLSTGGHNPTALNVDPAHTAAAGLLAALTAALAAAGYSWFATEQFNPLMAGRGLVAGLAVAAAGAPFVPLWLLVGAGLVMGLLLPLLIYLFEREPWPGDALGAMATYGVSALVGLVLVGLFASGQAGQGWNRLGLAEFAGVEGQGVSGLVVATGFAPDWPGQLQAQLLGLGAIVVWSLLLGLVVLQLYLTVSHAWARTRLDAEAPVDSPVESPAEEDIGLA